MSQRDLQDAYLTNALIDAHGDDSEFGYRFLAGDRMPPDGGHRNAGRRSRRGRRGPGSTTWRSVTASGLAVAAEHLP